MRPARVGGIATVTRLQVTLERSEVTLPPPVFCSIPRTRQLSSTLRPLRAVGGARAAAVLLHVPAPRLVQPPAPAHVLRDPTRDLLRAAHEPPHLAAVARVEVALERAGVRLVAGRRDVEEHEQQRQLARL